MFMSLVIVAKKRKQLIKHALPMWTARLQYPERMINQVDGEFKEPGRDGPGSVDPLNQP